jgi:uncharacterized protein YrrD
MLKSAKSIIQNKVIALDSGNVLGSVQDLITNTQGSKIVAFVLDFPGLWGNGRVVSPIDIVEYGPELIIVHNNEQVVGIEEIAYLKELIKLDARPLQGKAIDTNQKYLGKVDDLIFDSCSSTIRQYAVAVAQAGQLLLSVDLVVNVADHAVVFNQLTQKVTESITTTQTVEPIST